VSARWTFLAVSVAIGVLTGGCGGSDGGSSTGLSKAQFVKQANAICGSSRTNILKELGLYLQKHKNSKESEDEIFTDAVQAIYVPEVEEELTKLRALHPPEADKATIAAMINGQQKALDAIGKQKSIHEGRFGVEVFFDRAGQVAREYGISQCANNEPPS
jgi:hypothetical protein